MQLTAREGSRIWLDRLSSLEARAAADPSVRQTKGFAGQRERKVRANILVVRPMNPDEGCLQLDAKRAPLGSPAEVEEALRQVFGNGTTQGLGQWVFDGDGFSVLANLGIHGTVDSITFELWGASDPTSQIRDLCLPRGWEAVDMDSRKVITRLSEE